MKKIVLFFLLVLFSAGCATTTTSDPVAKTPCEEIHQETMRVADELKKVSDCVTDIVFDAM